jgi:hypothetical protein
MTNLRSVPSPVCSCVSKNDRCWNASVVSSVRPVIPLIPAISEDLLFKLRDFGNPAHRSPVCVLSPQYPLPRRPLAC